MHGTQQETLLAADTMLTFTSHVGRAAVMHHFWILACEDVFPVDCVLVAEKVVVQKHYVSVHYFCNHVQIHSYNNQTE